ncbi:MAG: glycosyltransferase family 4 protein [Chloroflexota bacterium]
MNMRDISVVLVGTYPPRHDGLATFAADLNQGLARQDDMRVRIVAIEPEGETFQYGRAVVGRIEQNDRASYQRAADLIRRLRPDVVSVQHEYGLWGVWRGELEADFAVAFLQSLGSGPHSVPVVSTLHTIRPSPGDAERDVLRGIVENSTACVTMARTGAMLVLEDYDISTGTLIRIPHGVPIIERRPRRHFKRRLNLEGRTIISTLGMLDPRKGIEYAIAAMKDVAHEHPEALYLIVGETHPEYRKENGEHYRNELRGLVRELGLTNNVRFVNHYLDDRELVDYLQASDVYLTPYLDRNQITSGTLAFAVGAGKAIVSTPYPHATEALAEGRGLLAEFRSAESIANCLLRILADVDYRQDMERRTAAYGKQDSWPLVAARYAEVFRRVAAGDSLADMLALEPEPLSPQP